MNRRSVLTWLAALPALLAGKLWGQPRRVLGGGEAVKISGIIGMLACSFLLGYWLCIMIEVQPSVTAAPTRPVDSCSEYKQAFDNMSAAFDSLHVANSKNENTIRSCMDTIKQYRRMVSP